MVGPIRSAASAEESLTKWLRFFQTPSFYTYAENDLPNLTDATGLQAERPSNLPLGLPQKFWKPFADGFAEALNCSNSHVTSDPR